MKNKRSSIRLFILFLLLGMVKINPVWSQKMDIDSLLNVAVRQVNEEKNYVSALKKTHQGIKSAPDYLDFYLLTGRIYQLTNSKDSAIYYYNYVINKNPAYEDAFTYLINMEIENKNYAAAATAVSKAIETHPEKKDFRYKKLIIYQLQGEKKKSDDYLKEIQALYPKDSQFKLYYFMADSQQKSDRIGINYNYTSFDRKDYGPWHDHSLQYIHQRDWGAAIARINYSNRSNGQNNAQGIQYEAESYLFTSKNSYSYLGAGYSNDPVFPKLRLGYSFFHNFKKGWEGDAGIRYITTENSDITAAAAGIGKYIGSYWINLRSFFQFENSSVYPAFTLTTRYYFDTRFDYLTFIAGYGTSPDERTTLGQIQQRLSLNSYRMGAGYYRIFAGHYLTGIQLNYNNQEYTPEKKQNETEIALMFQYQF